MTDKKILPKVPKPTLEGTITKNVIDFLSPKIDKLYEKVTNERREDMKEIRELLEKKNPPVENKGAVATADQMNGIINDLLQGKMPVAPQQGDQQQVVGGGLMQDPSVKIELIKMIFGMFKETPTVAGLNPQMLQEINTRQQIAMTNMTNQLFAQITRDMMKRLGATDDQITNIDSTNKALMSKVHDIGKVNQSEDQKKALRDRMIAELASREGNPAT